MNGDEIRHLLETARPMQQVQRTTIIHAFSYQVHELPDGGRQIDIITPAGEIIALPLADQHARDLANKLTAPRVQVANGHQP